MRIPGFHGLDPVILLRESVRNFFDHDMATHAAALTYHLLFSIFPFTIFVIALLGFLELSNLFDWLRQLAQGFFLERTMQQVNLVLVQLQQRRLGLLSFGVIFALWASSSAFRSAMHALNVVYGVREGRAFWRHYPIAILYTLAIGAIMLLAAAVALTGPQAMRWLVHQFGLDPSFAALWTSWLRWPVVVLLLTLAIAVVYSAAPDVEQRFRFITPGAFVAVLVWIAASLVFRYYVRNVANFDATYGSVGTIVMLLLYSYISSVVLLFGAEINAVIEHYAPSGKNPGDKTLNQSDNAGAGHPKVPDRRSPFSTATPATASEDEGAKHEEDGERHRSGCEPAKGFESARNDKPAHHFPVGSHQHRDEHDGNGDDAVDDCAPVKRLDGIDGGEADCHAAQRRQRNDAVKFLGQRRFQFQAVAPFESPGHRICSGARQYRQAEQAGADDSKAEQRKRKVPCNRAKRFGRLCRTVDGRNPV